MHKRARWLVAALALCAASGALAVTKNGTLYVKARNTRLMGGPPPNTTVKTILQPGQTVKWLGADPKNKQWHNVEVSGQKGSVFQSNLSTTAPSMEMVAKEGAPKMDVQALASAGAAVRGLSSGAIAYGRGKNSGKQRPTFSEAVEQIQKLEKDANTVQPEDLARHAEEAQLFPVVGSGSVAKRGGK